MNETVMEFATKVNFTFWVNLMFVCYFIQNDCFIAFEYGN